MRTIAIALGNNGKALSQAGIAVVKKGLAGRMNGDRFPKTHNKLTPSQPT